MHSVTSKSEKPAQKPKNGKKQRRTRAERTGRLKYIIQLIKRQDARIDKIDLRTRQIIAGLHGILSFEPNYIEKVACSDEVDTQIIGRLIYAGEGGISTSDLAQALPQYGLKWWNITRRLQRMNKKLVKELDKKVAEQRGRKWAATCFIRVAWSLPAKEVKEELLEED